jgi:hypothetical protein
VWAKVVPVIVVVLAVGAVLTTLVWPSPTPGMPASAAPTQAPSDIPGTLQRQAAALVAGDEAGWMAPVNPRNAPLQAEYRKQFKVLRALGVTSFQPVHDPSELDLYRQWPAGSLSALGLKVFFGYCVQTATCPRAAGPDEVALVAATEGFAAKLTWFLDHGMYVISDFTPVEDRRVARPAPWLTEDLQTSVGQRVSVLVVRR